MTPLPNDVSDVELLTLADRWVSLLEREDYEAAFALTDHIEEMGWTADLIREVIKSYGEALDTQRVTLLGEPTDVVQRKQVDRWPAIPGTGCFGEIWYDLNIDGFVSDLTATFLLYEGPTGVVVRLNDIHVM
jgi:hypothetical protein